jgi:hypothetical protein
LGVNPAAGIMPAIVALRLPDGGCASSRENEQTALMPFASIGLKKSVFQSR